MTEFKVMPTVDRLNTMCEVWIDGKMVASIYPSLNGIAVISRHTLREPVRSIYSHDVSFTIIDFNKT